MMRHLLVCLLLSACAVVENPVTGKAERTVLDVQAEIAAGKEAHEQIVAEYGRLEDPALQAYIDRIGRRLAQQSHRSELAWHFTLLDSPEVNAFALPGGYVYLTRGILAYMESEADLAGVIGHEIGHVTARHASQRATRQQTAGIGVFAAGVLGALLESRGASGAADLATQLSQGAAAGYIASYSRSQELQADRLGAEYLARVRYDPRNMIDVIEVLKDQEQFAIDQAEAQGREAPQGNEWLASHPSNEQRLEEIRQIAARYAGQYQDDGRERYLRAIDGLRFGESPAQGLTRGRNFYHPELGVALTAPRGWQIRNSPASVAVVNDRGDAALIVRLVPQAAGSDHGQIVRRLIDPVQVRSDATELNGMPATRFSGTRRTAQGQTVSFDVTVVSGPSGRRYLMVPAGANEQALQRAGAELRQALTSFRPMTAADRAAARPWTLRTVPYPRGGFAELARQSPLGERALQQLRLLNGVYATGEPEPGQLVKVVVESP